MGAREMEDTGVGMPLTLWTLWRNESTKSMGRSVEEGRTASTPIQVTKSPTASPKVNLTPLSPKKSIQKLRFEEEVDSVGGDKSAVEVSSGVDGRRKNVGLRGSNSIGSFRSYAEMERKGSVGALELEGFGSDVKENEMYEDPNGSEKEDPTNVVVLPSLNTGSSTANSYTYAKLILERPPPPRLRERGQSFASSNVYIAYPCSLQP